MTIKEDWAMAAASEIMLKITAKTITTDFTVADIIEKHCPFKRDVAYMPVPRCDRCKLWTPRPELDAGRCGLREKSSAKLWPELYDGIITTADFGCVQWEAK